MPYGAVLLRENIKGLFGPQLGNAGWSYCGFVGTLLKLHIMTNFSLGVLVCLDMGSSLMSKSGSLLGSVLQGCRTILGT